jgi:hypothetical protein
MGEPTVLVDDLASRNQLERVLKAIEYTETD